MVHRFFTTPETARELTALKKKNGFYFRTLSRTDNIDRVHCEVTDPGYQFIKENGIVIEELTYDVVFNDDESTNAKGMEATKVDAILYVKLYNGTNESYFADYKGGVVQVVCNETGDVVYEETVR